MKKTQNAIDPEEVADKIIELAFDLRKAVKARKSSKRALALVDDARTPAETDDNRLDVARIRPKD